MFILRGNQISPYYHFLFLFSDSYTHDPFPSEVHFILFRFLAALLTSKTSCLISACILHPSIELTLLMYCVEVQKSANVHICLHTWVKNNFSKDAPRCQKAVGRSCKNLQIIELGYTEFRVSCFHITYHSLFLGLSFQEASMNWLFSLFF
jgi:hypothetical protein